MEGRYGRPPSNTGRRAAAGSSASHCLPRLWEASRRAFRQLETDSEPPGLSDVLAEEVVLHAPPVHAVPVDAEDGESGPRLCPSPG